MNKSNGVKSEVRIGKINYYDFVSNQKLIRSIIYAFNRSKNVINKY